MTDFNPHALLADSRIGVLATIKSNGLPQLSPVTPFYDQDAGVIYVSITEGRAKTANLRRDPRAALEVTSSDGWAWATAEGAVNLIGPGTDPNGPEVDGARRLLPQRRGRASGLGRVPVGDGVGPPGSHGLDRRPCVRPTDPLITHHPSA